MKWHSILALALMLPAMGAAADDAGVTLRVDIDGARPAKDQVLVTLFDGPDSYMKTPFAEDTAPIEPNGIAAVNFENLPAGDYAVSVIHDKDSDGKLDTGLFGIPKEKIGFSNNARGRMGPAPWEKARFDLTEEASKISISLRKAKRE